MACPYGRDITDQVMGEGTLPAATTVTVQDMVADEVFLPTSCAGVTMGGRRVRVTVASDIVVFSPAFAVVARSNTFTVPGYADVVVQGDSV